MAKQNSTKWKILVATIAIDNLTDLSFEVNNKLIDVTTKDSAGWEEYLGGLKGATFSCSGIVDDVSTNYSPVDALTQVIAGTSVAIECSDAVSGNSKFSFSGIFEKFSKDGGVEGVIKFSLSGKATGAVTPGTVS
jgi:predicted secreted protein